MPFEYVEGFGYELGWSAHYRALSVFEDAHVEVGNQPKSGGGVDHHHTIKNDAQMDAGVMDI